MNGWVVPLLAAVICYGLAQGVYKQALLSAGQFCLLFVATKTVVSWGAWAASDRRPFRDPGARSFLRWSLIGQVVNGVGWIFYFVALGRGPAALVGTITAAYTAVTATLAMVFLRERLARAQAIGVALVVVAGMILGHGGGGDAAGGASAGWLAASLCAMAFWGTAVCLFKHAYNQPGADDHRFFVINWAGALVTLLPFGLYDARGARWEAGTTALGAVIALLYSLGDLGLFAALRRGPASVVSPLSGLYPILTIAYAALVLHEALDAPAWAAVALVLVGATLVVRRTPVLLEEQR